VVLRRGIHSYVPPLPGGRRLVRRERYSPSRVNKSCQRCWSARLGASTIAAWRIAGRRVHCLQGHLLVQQVLISR